MAKLTSRVLYTVMAVPYEGCIYKILACDGMLMATGSHLMVLYSSMGRIFIPDIVHVSKLAEHQRNLHFLLCFGTICQSASIFLVDIRSHEGAVKLQHGLGTV